MPSRLGWWVAIVGLFLAGCPASDVDPVPDPATCIDDLLNGEETDVDCGGPDCTSCTIDATCADNDDCATGLCEGGACSCPDGYAATGANPCTDIDECAEELDDCDASAECNNTDGGFTCTCPAGTQMAIDVCVACDEGTWGDGCAETCDMGPCGSDATCDPVTGAGVGCGSCPDGSWGVLCDTSCDPGQCLGDVTCTQAAGERLTCEGGCAVGYMGMTCDETCEQDDCRVCNDDVPCPQASSCIEGFCLLDGGEACASDHQCADVCIERVCDFPSETGGACEGATHCLAQLESECVEGTCLITPGTECTDNTECVDVCIGGTCALPAATREACDEQDDCVAGHDCIEGRCLVILEEGCDDNIDCESQACVNQTCAQVADLYGACDDADDCSTELVCAFGSCLLAHGTSCDGNHQCAGTCIRGVCAPLQPTRGVCDEELDCEQQHYCVASECRRRDGLLCGENNECVNVCVEDLCRPVRELGETCDETADCITGAACVDGVCLYDEGQACDENPDCVEVCIFETCRPPSDTGGQCDEVDDCVAGHECIADTCLAIDGEDCDINADCVNVCIFGTCGPQSPLDETCDENDDCVSNHVCTDADVCKRAEGAECTIPADCATPNTDCVSGRCRTDITPRAFNFTDQSCVDPGAVLTSNTVTLNAFYGPLNLEASGSGNPTVILNSTELSETSTTVVEGDQLALRMAAPSTTNQTATATVEVGTRTRDWQIRTAPGISPGTPIHTETDVLLGGSRNAYGAEFSPDDTGLYTFATYMKCRDRIHYGEYHYTLCSARLEQLSGAEWTTVVSHSHTNGQCCTAQGYVLNRSSTVSLSSSTTYRIYYRARPRISSATTVYESSGTVSFLDCE